MPRSQGVRHEAGDVGTAGKTFNNRQTLTGRTGAIKDRVRRELRRHTWNQINNQHEGKTRSQGAHGEQNHNKTVQGRDISPPLPEGASRTVHHPTGRGGGCSGHGDRTGQDRTGQEACNLAPVLGVMAGQGTRVAMAEQGAWAAMAERGARVAMVGQGTREAMVDRGAWVSMVDPGTQEAMAERGAWEAMAGQGTRGAMAGRGAWVSMVDPGTQEAMAERGAWEAMAGQGTREAMGGRGAWVSMVDPGTQEAMAERGAWEAMAGSPPKKCSWGFSSSPGGWTEPAGAL